MAAASPAHASRSPTLELGGVGPDALPHLELGDVIGYCLPYLSIKDCAALKATSKALASAAAAHSPEHLAIVKSALHATGASVRVFETYGSCLLSLAVSDLGGCIGAPLCCSQAKRTLTRTNRTVLPPTHTSPLQLHRVPFADKAALPSVLSLCPNLRRLSLHDCDWQWDDEEAAAAIASLSQLQELRLQCPDAPSGERNPFAAIVKRLRELPALRKLTLFSRLDGASVDALVAFVADHSGASRRLMKLKVSTGLLASPGGSELLNVVGWHAGLQKLTIVRPEGMGEPLRKPQCQQLALAVCRNHSLRALHLRRCGLWTDSLLALVPPNVCPHLTRLKLDGNSLGYLSGSYFVEALDHLLSKLPCLEVRAGACASHVRPAALPEASMAGHSHACVVATTPACQSMTVRRRCTWATTK